MLKGKVLKIVSQTKVLINLGSQQGVKIGMRFVIYDEGEMITDPTTNQPIEKLEIVKGEFEIIQVQQKISLGESFRIITKKTTPPWVDAYASMTETTTQKIKVEEPLTMEKIKEALPTPLKVGDLVRSIE